MFPATFPGLPGLLSNGTQPSTRNKALANATVSLLPYDGDKEEEIGEVNVGVGGRVTEFLREGLKKNIYF